MKYLSICSGIEAATVAWHHLGWQPAGFAEIEKFPAAVLKHHYPTVPNFEDLTKHEQWPLASGAVDLLVGGTPCQAFSVAGLRRGMDDARGQLTLEFVRLAARLRPRWIVWENVPGVLSSAGGRDFGSFLGALGELGYGWAYRVLDAQYFGVAQRRRRVFVVGYLGDWRRAAAVLFERESVRRDPPPRRESRESTFANIAPSLVSSGRGVARTGDSRGQDPVVAVAGCLGSRASSGNGFSTDFECAGGLQVVGALDCRLGAQRAQNAQSGHMIPVWPAEVAPTLNAAFGTKQGLEDQHALGGAGCFVPALPIAVETDCYNGSITGDVACTMGTPGSSVNASGPTVMQPVVTFGGDIARTLQARHDSSPCADRGMDVVATAMQVRRLTPVECERLQGFPDGYTDIKPRGKDTPDGPRYKALGNSMAVPVMRWIGERIEAVDKLPR